jgi:hypothetical protein
MNLMQALSIPQISRVARRTALSAVIVGVLGLLLLLVLNYPYAGLGLCIGIGLALGNFRLTAAAAAKAIRSEKANHRRPLALNTLGRLGLVTIVAIGLLLLKEQLGFGVLLGLAVFQFILLANMTVSLLKGAAFSTDGGADGTHDGVA